jgi:hypothetical protein
VSTDGANCRRNNLTDTKQPGVSLQALMTQVQRGAELGEMTIGDQRKT